MSQLDALRTAILSLDGPVFAVLDGAQFENLPQTLMFAGIEARCLYLDRGDNHPERLVTAPYLVGPLEGETLDRVLSALPKTSAAVFWECPDGADALYRHLRGINMVQIPPGAEAETTQGAHEAPEPLPGEKPLQAVSGETTPGYDSVLFRHADANVLGRVLPHLSTSQSFRLYGPASRLVFSESAFDRSSAGISVYENAIGADLRGVGALRFDDEFMMRIDEDRMTRSRRNIRDYLQETAPDYTERLSDDDMDGLLANAERTGDDMGLETEHGHGLWALLLLITGQSLLNSQELRNHIAGSTASPDEAVAEIVAELADADDETWEGWVP